MYIAELSPPALRGTLVTVNQVAICTGILVGYGVTKVIAVAKKISRRLRKKFKNLYDEI
jgi:hypothetical protein